MKHETHAVKRSRLQSVLTAALAIVCVGGQAYAQRLYLDWEAHAKPVYQEPDYNFVKDPSVFRDKDGLYHMYYTGSANGFQGSSPAPWRIDHATSPDGLQWTKRDTAFVADDDTWERGRVQAPSKPVWHDGQYYLFYAGGPRTPGNIAKISYATSTDLKTWTKCSTCVVSHVNGANKANDPFVYQEDGKYYLFYTTYPGGKESVFYRTSSNLMDWSAPVASGGWGEGAVVWKEGDQYYMLGANGSSSKGETYSLFRGGSLDAFQLVGELRMDTPDFAADSWGHGDIVVDGGVMQLYFQGTRDHGRTFQIGLAKCGDSETKVGETKVSLSPTSHTHAKE